MTFDLLFKFCKGPLLCKQASLFVNFCFFQSIIGMINHFIQCRIRRPGAIIGDGDRKRAPFLVLGLYLWYGTIFLFLEQIAPSPTAHARTFCEDFCGCSARKWRPKFPKCLVFLAHKSIRSCLLEVYFSIFVVSCSSLSEIRQCRI